MPTPPALIKADYDFIGNPVRSAIPMLGALAWVPEGEVAEAYHIIKPTLSNNIKLSSLSYADPLTSLKVGTTASITWWDALTPPSTSSRLCSTNRHSHQSRLLLINRNAWQLRDAWSGLTLRSSRMTKVKLMILKRKKIWKRNIMTLKDYLRFYLKLKIQDYSPIERSLACYNSFSLLKVPYVHMNPIKYMIHDLYSQCPL